MYAFYSYIFKTNIYMYNKFKIKVGLRFAFMFSIKNLKVVIMYKFKNWFIFEDFICKVYSKDDG